VNYAVTIVPATSCPQAVRLTERSDGARASAVLAELLEVDGRTGGRRGAGGGGTHAIFLEIRETLFSGARQLPDDDRSAFSAAWSRSALPGPCALRRLHAGRPAQFPGPGGVHPQGDHHQVQPVGVDDPGVGGGHRVPEAAGAVDPAAALVEEGVIDLQDDGTGSGSTPRPGPGW